MRGFNAQAFFSTISIVHARPPAGTPQKACGAFPFGDDVPLRSASGMLSQTVGRSIAKQEFDDGTTGDTNEVIP